MIIAIGSSNPTKTGAVQDVFQKHFATLSVRAVPVASGVPEQPLSEEETYQGALTRATTVLEAVPEAVYGVGIEGGLQQYGFGWFERELVVIVNRNGEQGVGSSGGIVLPEQIIQRIHAGETLEQVIDEAFETSKIGEGRGMFGILTKDIVTRRTGLEHGVAFALARFLHPTLYSAG